MTRVIPFIRASFFEPFLDTARSRGIPLEKHLRLAHSPISAFEPPDPDSLIAEIPCWTFLRSVSRAEGLETFSLVTLRGTPFHAIGSCAAVIAGSLNLNQLLTTVCAAAPLLSSSAAYRLETSGRWAWLANTGRRLFVEDTQAQLFQVFGMIQFVQLAAGPNWRPDEIRFTFPRNKTIADAEDLNPSRILFDQATPGILFPRHILSMTVGRGLGERRKVRAPPARFSDQLSEVMLPYLGGDHIDKRIAAEIIGVSPRTLQRRLDEESTSFSKVLERLRMQRAQAMLGQPDIKLIEIAFELGYENQPSFTRAFRRWAGVTPSEYRDQLLRNHPMAAA